MLTLCRFYGLIIRMYLKTKEHNPPHVHVIYWEDFAAIRIEDGSIIEGELPSKALSLSREWISLNKDALLKMWETNEFAQLDPLK